MREALAATLLLLVSAGCATRPASSAPAARAGVTTRATLATAHGARAYVLHRPGAPAPPAVRTLVVVLHGCVQSADDIARGTRMDQAADRAGFVALYPEQPATANPQRCWNWFLPEHTARDRGEAGLLAALIDTVVRREKIAPSRVALVGMSAGAAMAGALAVAYPERYAALALHSGIPASAVADISGALRAMREGVPDLDAPGAAALAAMGARRRGVPVIVLHGATDAVVSPLNLAATVRQWRAVNAAAGPPAAPVEQHLFAAVGHAWSRGSAAGSFTAPGGPDATALVLDFFRRVGVLATP